MAPGIELSVVICTYKRPELAVRLLRSLGRQDLPRERFEIIVVDNFPDGRTQAALDAFEDPLRRRIRFVPEPVTGLSNARNTGVRESEAPVIVFIDDDAVAPQGWASAYVSLFSESEADAGGGPVNLEWDPPKPDWVTPSLASYFGHLDLGPVRRPRAGLEMFAGLNFAVRRHWFSRVGSFSPKLGLQGDKMAGMEEVDLLLKIERSGGALWYEPRAVVLHGVPALKRSRSFVRRRAFMDGRSVYRMKAQTGDRMPVSASLSYIGSHGGYAVRARDTRLEFWCKILFHAGVVVEAASGRIGTVGR